MLKQINQLFKIRRVEVFSLLVWKWCKVVLAWPKLKNEIGRLLISIFTASWPCHLGPGLLITSRDTDQHYLHQMIPIFFFHSRFLWFIHNFLKKDQISVQYCENAFTLKTFIWRTRVNITLKICNSFLVQPFALMTIVKLPRISWHI